MPRTRDAGVDPQHIVDPADPALSDEVLDETVPGGAYIVNEVPVDADGNTLEAPPDPPILLSADDSNLTTEQKQERLAAKAKYEQDKLRWEENKRKRDEWEKDREKDRAEREKKRAEREKTRAPKAEQLPAEKERS